MKAQIITALKIFLAMTILTGIVYPLFITGIAQIMFPGKADGSLITVNYAVIGSKLIGQKFHSEGYFSSRPSSVSYNPLPSGGSNYGLTNVKLKNLVADRKKEFVRFNHLDSITVIPPEMLFSSASGLDPHISPEAALLQAERVALARNFNNSQKEKLLQSIKTLTETPQFGLLGQCRINVLLLNLEVEKIK